MPRWTPATLLIVVLLVATGSANADSDLVPAGSTWKYLADGSNQGTAWTGNGFADAAWPAGAAQLGYGDGDEATLVGYGPDPDHKFTTTYFRHGFSVADPSAFRALELRLLRDDGAVVYLNGTEIHRSNMPNSAVTSATFALGAIGGADESAFGSVLLAPDLLLAGTNVLAVEIHQAGFTSSDISFDLALTGLTEITEPFTQAPRLIFAGTNTEMEIVWRTALTMPATLAWGTDTSCAQGSVQTAEYGRRHLHAHTISELIPGTKYFYRVIAGGDTLGGSFRAAPPASATAVKFLAYGDTRTYPATHDLVAASMVDAYRQDADLQTMTVMVGDLVTDGNDENLWQSEFFDPAYAGIREMLATLPFQSCIGNHEGSGELFTEFFPYPFVSGRYWSFDYGPAHFAMVDQYVDYTAGSAQLAWLQSDLAATDKPWRFIVLHEPGWSAGGHGNELDVQDFIQPLCLQYGVAVVFGGHNHYYARAEVGGVQHITTGGGGAPLYAPDPGFPFVVATGQAHHFCKVEIAGSSLTLTALMPDGVVLDSLTLSAPSAVQPPADETPAPGIILQPAFPNPFNGATTIVFSVPAQVAGTLVVYDVTGARVRTLAAGEFVARSHRVIWDGTDDRGRGVESGVYFFRLNAGTTVRTGRVVLVK